MSSDLKSNFLQINIAMTEGNKNGVYLFDRFKIDCDKLMLYRDEIEISLPPKIVKTLAVLIENQGMILSKDELLEKVWPDAIVEESAHARLRWLTLDDAIDLAAEDNLRTTLVRVGELFIAV